MERLRRLDLERLRLSRSRDRGRFDLNQERENHTDLKWYRVLRQWLYHLPRTGTFSSRSATRPTALGAISEINH